MKTNKRFISCIVEIVIGLILITCSLAGVLDEFWCGCGTGLIAVSSIFLFRQIKYKTNTEYKESVDVERNDERNKYLAMKAWSWAGYIFVILAAISTIVLKLTGHEEGMMITSASVSLIVLLYWISFMILKKKY